MTDGWTFAITTGDAPDNGTALTIETDDATITINLAPDDVAALHRTLSFRPGAVRVRYILTAPGDGVALMSVDDNGETRHIYQAENGTPGAEVIRAVFTRLARVSGVLAEDQT